MKKTLRLNLTDTVCKENVDYVLFYLSSFKKEIPEFIVYLWYLPDEYTDFDIIKLKQTHRVEFDLLEVSFNVIKNYEEFCWYDVINEEHQTLFEKYKFRSTYKNREDIIISLMEFKQMITFEYNRLNGKNGQQKTSSDNWKSKLASRKQLNN